MGITIFVICLVVILFTVVLPSRENRRRRELLQSITNLNRGTYGEKDIILQLTEFGGISPQAIFHDLYIKKHNGKTSQIDLVVATKVGIIVLEVKNYSGWIFGKGYQDNWTQVLAYGREKYRFYNPIKQNNGHIHQLQKLLGEDVPFYSIVVFGGTCELRDISFIPNGTFVVKERRLLEVINNILNNNPSANYSNKQRVVEILKQAAKNGEVADTEQEHIDDIKDMLGKDRVYK